MNALDVTPVGVCARAMWGATTSAKDKRKAMGDMGIKKGKNTGDLGGGKEQRLASRLVGATHGFYEPAKIQQTEIAKRVHRGYKSSGIALVVIPSVAGQHSGLGRKRWSERGARLQGTESRHGGGFDLDTPPDVRFLPLLQSVNEFRGGGQEINNPKLGSPFALLPPSPLPSPSVVSVAMIEHGPTGVRRRLVHDDEGLPDYGAASSGRPSGKLGDSSPAAAGLAQTKVDPHHL